MTHRRTEKRKRCYWHGPEARPASKSTKMKLTMPTNSVYKTKFSGIAKVNTGLKCLLKRKMFIL